MLWEPCEKQEPVGQEGSYSILTTHHLTPPTHRTIRLPKQSACRKGSGGCGGGAEGTCGAVAAIIAALLPCGLAPLVYHHAFFFHTHTHYTHAPLMHHSPHRPYPHVSASLFPVLKWRGRALQGRRRGLCGGWPCEAEEGLRLPLTNLVRLQGTDRGVNQTNHTLSCRAWTRRFERCRYVWPGGSRGLREE